ncbi:MAG: phosphatase PAP2 family protein [Gemmatimonas sp.]
MKKLLLASALFAFDSANALAQETLQADTAVASSPAWISRHDLGRAAGAVSMVGLLSLADERVAHGLQRQSLQSNHTLNNAADAIQVAGDPGALLLSVSLFVVGKVAHRNGLANASLRSTEAIVASGALTQLLKLSVGRGRPVVTHDSNAYVFHPFHGAQTNFNSFPSGHSTAAFAAATVFSTEIRYAHPRAAKFTTPLLYGLATAVGTARMYNDRHWLSDVVGGALIGHFVGRKITSRVARQHHNQ